MKLKKCPHCNLYTLKDKCPKCKKQCTEAHYKFIKIRNAPETKTK